MFYHFNTKTTLSLCFMVCLSVHLFVCFSIFFYIINMFERKKGKYPIHHEVWRYTMRLWQNPNTPSQLIVTDVLDAKIRSLMEKGQRRWLPIKVYVCGNMAKGSRMNMTHYVETHTSGVSYPCGKCGKVSMTNPAVKMHAFINHKE